MKVILPLAIIITFFSPDFVLAQSVGCSKEGFTVLTINGVFTNENGARGNMQILKDKVGELNGEEGIKYNYLLNPSHIGGIGDILAAALQKYFEASTVTDYDLVEMLKTASEKVKTQKVLLVAHSQGNFYANSFYDSVAGHDGGVPVKSIGVYGVATPAGRIVGNEKYLTSDTDKVIAGLVRAVPGRGIMPPNTHINLGPADDYLGHNFADVYLKYKGEKIVSDIQYSLDSLSSDDTKDITAPCIEPPRLSIVHKVEGVVLSVLDPIAGGTVFVATNTITGVYNIAEVITGTTTKIATTLGLMTRSFFVSKPGPAIVAAVAASTESSVSASETAISETEVEESNSNNDSVSSKQENMPQQTNVSAQISTIATGSISTDIPAPAPQPPDLFAGFSGIAPGFGGGGPPPVTVSAPEPEPQEPAVIAPPIFTLDLPVESSFATDTVNFSGTKTEGAQIVIEGLATTSADGTTWNYTGAFPEGTTTLNFFATKEGTTSQPASKTFNVAVPDTAYTFPFLSSPDHNTTASIFSGTKEKQSTLSIAWGTRVYDSLAGGYIFTAIGSSIIGPSVHTNWGIDTQLSPGNYHLVSNYQSSTINSSASTDFTYNPYYDPIDTTTLSITPFLSGTISTTTPAHIYITHKKGVHITYEFSNGYVVSTGPSFSNSSELILDLPPGAYGYTFRVFDGANQQIQSGSTSFTLVGI